jgi:hypothetical protein
MLLYSEGTVCPGATEPSFKNGVSSDGCSTNGVPNSRYEQVRKQGHTIVSTITHLWNVFILFISLAIVIDEHTTHSKVRHCWRMLFLGVHKYSIP